MGRSIDLCVPYAVHTHIKDGYTSDGNVHYLLPGDGNNESGRLHGLRDTGRSGSTNLRRGEPATFRTARLRFVENRRVLFPQVGRCTHGGRKVYGRRQIARGLKAVGKSKTGRILIWDQRPPCIEERMDDIISAAPGYSIEMCGSAEELESQIEGAEVVATDGLSGEAVARARDLRWMHTWSAGVDNLVPPGLDKTDVIYTCGKGNGGVTMAEWAMMLMLMWSKKATHYLAAHEQRRWAPLPHGELNGQVVGIIGLGNSGADLARKCQAFHMTVLGMRRSAVPCDFVDEMFGLDNLHEMLARSDYVVVTTPITDQTRGMIGEAEFQAMKPDAYFIVTSRGGVADGQAMLRALEQGWIAGAGLDAHETRAGPARFTVLVDAGRLHLTPLLIHGHRAGRPRRRDIHRQPPALRRRQTNEKHRRPKARLLTPRACLDHVRPVAFMHTGCLFPHEAVSGCG